MVGSLEIESAHTAFWDDRNKAQEILKKLTVEKEQVASWEKALRKERELSEYLELAVEEEDPDAVESIAGDIKNLKQEVDILEIRKMLSGENDEGDAILTIHPGAGGTESQDWAQMLMRMYSRWIERKGFEASILDLLMGDEAGIKSATIEVKGKYAFGLLSAESGVHRLVRISPFDSNKRRHTSFASVFVFPVVENDEIIDINPNDLRVDTFRASGAGGQHVNKTDSAVRITHLPTGIVVQCQNERSQHKNRANALKVLKARLYQQRQEEELKEREKMEESKKDIAWGSQIRSYVMHPYNMVKDHRTGVETSNVQAVMEGVLDEFIQGFLLRKKSLAPV